MICVSYFLCLQENPCQHPIIVLRDIKYEDVNSLLHFMYNGEVNVAQDSLNSFLKCAESLRVRGLTDEESSRVSAVPAPGPGPGQHGRGGGAPHEMTAGQHTGECPWLKLSQVPGVLTLRMLKRR